MKRLLLTIGLLLNMIGAFSQETQRALPDSLVACLQEEQGQNRARVQALAKVCDFFFVNEQYDEALPYIREMRELDSLLSDNVVIATTYYYWGNYLLGKNELKEAMQRLLAAENGASMLRENNENLRLHIRTLVSLGVCYFKCQLVPEAFKCFQKGLEYNEKLGDSELNCLLKTDISQVYLSMDDTRKALAINKELLADTTISNPRKSSPCISIGNLYIDMQAYDSAQVFLDSANYYAVSIQDKIWIIMLKSDILRRTEQYDEAITLQCAGLDSLKEHPNPELELPLLMNTVRCHYYKEDYAKALEYADLAIAKMNENPLLLLDADVYKWKSKILEKQGHYQEALGFLKTAVAINDSVVQVNSLGHLYELELQRNIKEVEENAKLEQYEIKAKYQKGRLLWVLALMTLVAVVAVVLLLLKRKNILLQSKEEKEEMLSKELDQRNRELAAKALANAAEGKPLEDFDYYFVQTHPDFYNRLRADYPNLTPYELRLCAYLRLNLSTKDIATLNNISLDSARVARHRLRKTLGITNREESLVQFLSKY